MEVVVCICSLPWCFGNAIAYVKVLGMRKNWGSEFGSHLEQLITKLSELGMALDYDIFNCLDAGFPQGRKRVFALIPALRLIAGLCPDVPRDAVGGLVRKTLDLAKHLLKEPKCSMMIWGFVCENGSPLAQEAAAYYRDKKPLPMMKAVRGKRRTSKAGASVAIDPDDPFVFFGVHKHYFDKWELEWVEPGDYMTLPPSLAHLYTILFWLSLPPRQKHFVIFLGLWIAKLRAMNGYKHMDFSKLAPDLFASQMPITSLLVARIYFAKRRMHSHRCLFQLYRTRVVRYSCCSGPRRWDGSWTAGRSALRRLPPLSSRLAVAIGCSITAASS